MLDEDPEDVALDCVVVGPAVTVFDPLEREELVVVVVVLVVVVLVVVYAVELTGVYVAGVTPTRLARIAA